MKKQTHLKLRKLAVISWFVNAALFTITLFSWHYAKSVGSWTEEPLETMFLTSSITKFVLSFIVPVALAMAWDGAVSKEEKEL